MTYREACRRLPAWLVRRVFLFETFIEDSVSAFARSLEPGARLLDAGAGEAQYAGHFPRARYVAVDLAIGDPAWDYRRLDAVADLERLPFRDGCFDAALNIVTLEHLPRPLEALREIARVLRRGGRMLVIAPQEWEVHQAPHDYYRYTRYGLAHLLGEAGFDVEEMTPSCGLFGVLARRLFNACQMAPWLLPAFAPLGLLVAALDGLDRRRDFTLGYRCIARRR
ncbi:MAG: class I SAM-dependent methyltransferase [Bryobacteraceae bacterium]|nr:class I SAM-dependent methyltransferase [Bryobacteraceae bacterium]MCX7603372.1 class I SAM-dependent methyltransferase [Bryobacteraceae bacterium]